MKRRFIQLNRTEEKALRDGYEKGHQFQFRSRCHCILLSNSGYEIKQLTEIFKVSRLTIYNWFDRWEKNGMDGLTNLPGQGRKKILDDAELHIIQEEIHANNQHIKLAHLNLVKRLSKDFSEITLKRYVKKTVSTVPGTTARVKIG